jgi:hypothetical protein
MNSVTKKNSNNNATAPHQDDGFLKRTVLRHYAANLRRSWRNAPRDAFVDATFQVEGVIAVTIACIFGLINFLLIRTIFPALAGNVHGKPGGVLIVAAIGLVCMVFVDKKLKQYEPPPGMALLYDTSRDRVLVYVFFASGFIILALGLTAAYFISRSFPSS